jgi:RNA polymerase sigma-70 factor (ECF subfamily)
VIVNGPRSLAKTKRESQNIALMDERESPGRNGQHDEGSQGTLGAVLYADDSGIGVSEQEWVELVRSIAGGDQRALRSLYERSHRMVYTLMVRITGSRETAEEVTTDVFLGVWQRAASYDPANGTVLGWIMNQARSRAIDRLRFDQRKKRVDPYPEPGDDKDTAAGPDEIAERSQAARRLQQAMKALTAREREAIETAYFSELSHAEAAERLDEPLGTLKTRIRSGLAKLRHALQSKPGKA